MSIEAILASDVLLRWLFIGSLVSFFGVLIVVPLIITRLPADYFSRPETSAFQWPDQHPLVWVPLLVTKNVLAVTCITVGIAMLVLPGQGILTIIVGLLLLDFPGKYRTERWLIRRPWIFRVFNRLRAMAGEDPFKV